MLPLQSSVDNSSASVLIKQSFPKLLSISSLMYNLPITQYVMLYYLSKYIILSNSKSVVPGINGLISTLLSIP